MTKLFKDRGNVILQIVLCALAFTSLMCSVICNIRLSQHLKEEPEVVEIIEPEIEIVEEVIEEEPEVVEIPLTREAQMFQDFNDLAKIEDKKSWYLAYKGFIEDYPDFDRGSTLYDRYNDDEIYLMERVIETETYGCDFEAKSHVASVILNRIEGDNNFSDDATTVCTSPNQFVYGRKQISEDTKLALEYAAEIEDTAQGALYFNCMTPMDSWNGRELKFTDHVGHSFY